MIFLNNEDRLAFNFLKGVLLGEALNFSILLSTNTFHFLS